jgi:UDP-N-acetylmuramate: L-alanyl-gamma-D-glutamyl-meso-diaminopimelate ligase
MRKNKTIKKVHLIGICGSGMSSLAVLLKESGSQVTGTDTHASGIFASLLKKNKITFKNEYGAKNIPEDVDLVVVGNNAPLAADANPETKQALSSGAKMSSLPEALAELAKDKENIVVAGSSGKSTCSALLAWCLFKAKKDPSYFMGAIPLDLKNSSHLGKGKEFVIEGDEYTSSKSDLRSKFLHFDPAHVLLTSAQHDHINVFPTESSYRKPYQQLVAKIPKNGSLAYADGGKNNLRISKYAKCRKISYSLLDQNSDWHARNIKYGKQSSFDLMRRGKNIAHIRTTLLGKHNFENIVGVGALLLENKKMKPNVFAQAISSFHGVKNRIELLNSGSGIPVYHGFGSSYEKARSFFDALKLHFPQKRIIAVFEPHSFSWRNRNFSKWYRDIFSDVEEVLMLPAPSYGKKDKDQLSTREVWNEAKKFKKIHTANTEQESLEIVAKIAKKGDVIALVSSGSLLGLNDSIPKLLKKLSPNLPR